MLDLGALTDPALTVLVSVAATWGAMRTKVVEISARMVAADKEVGELKDRVTRLEGRLDGLVIKLDGAVRSLERVTDKLEALAIKIAGGK